MTNGEIGSRVLVVDLDSQGNQADFFGVRERVYDPAHNPAGACLSNLFTDANCDTHEFVVSLDRSPDDLSRPNLFLTPATRELNFAVDNIAAIDSISSYQAALSRGQKKIAPARQLDTILSDRLKRVMHNFEFIIIDCPPNLDALKRTVYEFADEVIVPVKADRLSAIGAQQHTDDIVRMIREHDLKVRISYVVPTMMRARQVLAEQTLEMLLAGMGTIVWQRLFPIVSIFRIQQVVYGGAEPHTTSYTNDILGLTQVLAADNGATQTTNLFGLDLIYQDDGAATRTLLADGRGSVRTEMAGSAIETTTTYGPLRQPAGAWQTRMSALHLHKEETPRHCAMPANE